MGEPLEPACLCLPVLQLQTYAAAPSFCVGAGDLNSGPGACAAKCSHLRSSSGQVLEVYWTGRRLEVCWI